MIIARLSLLLFFCPIICFATDRKPWIDSGYEAEVNLDFLYQNYQSVQSPHGRCFRKSHNDLFATINVIFPYCNYRGEAEVTAAHTHHQNHRIDCYKLTGSYLFFDDNGIDPMSLRAGITLGQPLSRALHDISSFHHGHIEGEAWFSFGKQYGCSCELDYLYRWWNVFGVGIADVGSPWIREEAAIEWNKDNVRKIRLFLNSLWGTGKNSLNPHRFAGYGPIRHRSIDLGIKYLYNLDCWGRWSVAYAFRIYARNFPKNTNLILLEYNLPFGFQLEYAPY